MRKLNLDILKEGLPGVSPEAGSFYAQAALYCLKMLGHEPGVVLSVSGGYVEKFLLDWTGELDETIIRTWKDKEEATEYGAMGIAILLILMLTDYTVAGRMSKGGHTDFLLTKPQVSEMAKLEVSGIWKETKGNSVNARMKLKKRQAGGGFEEMPVYVSIIEFQAPKAKMTRI